MKWCVYCEKMVLPQKQFSFFAFVFTVGFYLVYWLLFKRRQCPSCGGKSFRRSKPQPKEA